MGTGTVHAVGDSRYSVYNGPDGYRLYYGGSYILPAEFRGLQVVVEIHNDSRVCVCATLSYTPVQILPIYYNYRPVNVTKILAFMANFRTL